MVMSHLPCEQVVVVVSLLALAVGVSGLTLAGGFYVNPYDIAPRYAINICTLSSTISTMSGIINPYIVAAMTLDVGTAVVNVTANSLHGLNELL